MSRRRRLIIALVLGLAAGVAYPFLDLAFSCGVAESEACVWGKAYLKLTLGLSLALLTPVVAVAAYVFIGLGSRRGMS